MKNNVLNIILFIYLDKFTFLKQKDDVSVEHKEIKKNVIIDYSKHLENLNFKILLLQEVETHNNTNIQKKLKKKGRKEQKG